jgi:hypothetical protein
MRDLHSGMMICLPLRRAIGSIEPRAFPRVMADPTHWWHSDYACNFARRSQGFRTVARRRMSVDLCRSSGRWINRGHVIAQ